MKTNICHGCLKETKSLKNNYCSSCIKELFSNTVPNKLNFNKKEFLNIRTKLSHRMSISGVQDKISLKFEANDLIPTVTDGRYILKPVPTIEQVKNENDIVANEHISMIISKQVFKINTASCGVIKFSDEELAYITKRFDYLEDNRKYDQEDFAALLNVSSYSHGKNYKYDAANYLECGLMIKKYVAASKIAIEDFFKRIVLNYIISNGDAHLKNFSLFSNPDVKDYLLTPTYDLLNTRYHINEVYGDMALDLLDDYTESFNAHGFYKKADFLEFGRLLDIPEKRMNKFFDSIYNSEALVEELVNKSFLSDKGKKYYIESYKDRIKRLS